eukprot:GHVN01082435.1.p1 GENE.GHVN01082435.1~~GHVN01082435.1.p1  ORF type:complete len:798 (+),score=82.40 GHVN01082435.1:2143-4536(+)
MARNEARPTIRPAETPAVHLIPWGSPNLAENYLPIPNYGIDLCGHPTYQYVHTSHNHAQLFAHTYPHHFNRTRLSPVPPAQWNIIRTGAAMQPPIGGANVNRGVNVNRPLDGSQTARAAPNSQSYFSLDPSPKRLGGPSGDQRESPGSILRGNMNQPHRVPINSSSPSVSPSTSRGDRGLQKPLKLFFNPTTRLRQQQTLDSRREARDSVPSVQSCDKTATTTTTTRAITTSDLSISSDGEVIHLGEMSFKDGSPNSVDPVERSQQTFPTQPPVTPPNKVPPLTSSRGSSHSAMQSVPRLSLLRALPSPPEDEFASPLPAPRGCQRATGGSWESPPTRQLLAPSKIPTQSQSKRLSHSPLVSPTQPRVNTGWKTERARPVPAVSNYPFSPAKATAVRPCINSSNFHEALLTHRAAPHFKRFGRVPTTQPQRVVDTITLHALGNSVEVPKHSSLKETDVKFSYWGSPVDPTQVVYDTINSGTFCKVYRAHFRGRMVAIKCPEGQYLLRDPVMAEARAVQEWRILCRANHSNILQFIGGIDAGPKGIWLVTEYVSGGDLYALLHLRPSVLLRPVVRLRMMKQIADSLTYLHGLNPKVVHKDIKTNNILVDEQLNLKLCDFGDAEEMKSEFVQRYTAATWQYAPPEIIGADDPSCPEGTTEKVDVWALGCVFLEICLAATPFKHILETVPDLQQRDVLRERLRAGLLESDIRIPPFLPPRLTRLIRICLVIDSRQRASAEEVKHFIARNESLLLSELDFTQRVVEAHYTAAHNVPSHQHHLFAAYDFTHVSQHPQWMAQF